MNAAERRRLAEQLRQMIRDSGLSQAEICRRAEVDAAAVSRFMNGERGLSLETLERLAMVLGFDLVPRSPSSPKKK